jgi:hypothetical protein
MASREIEDCPSCPDLFQIQLVEEDTNDNQPSRFYLFPSLAPELRERVWEYASAGAAIVCRTWNNTKFDFALRRPVPTILHVCREARSCGMRRYQSVRQREKEGGFIYLDWMKDEVYIRRACMFQTPAEFLEQANNLL